MTARNLTRDDWLRASLATMARGGVRAIAVEPLAGTVGASKGSFYWHFRDRAELVRATLERWEQEETTGVIARLEPVSDPRERLRRLLVEIHSRLHSEPDASVALVGDDDERAREVVQRITARRTGYVEEQLRALGVPAGEAARRAVLAYSGYVGFAALARSAPAALPSGRAVVRYVDTVLDVLLR